MKKAQSWLSKDQVYGLLPIIPKLICYHVRAFARKPLEFWKFQILVRVCYEGALRIGEGVELKVKDIDVENSLLILRQTKTGFIFCKRCAKTKPHPITKKRILVRFDPKCKKCIKGKIYRPQYSHIPRRLVQAIQKVIKEENLFKDDWLFASPSFPDKHISERWVQYQLVELTDLADLTIFKQHKVRQVKNLYSHIFRRSKAKQMIEDGFNLPEIMKKLRHDNIKTTSSYLESDLSDLQTKEYEMYG